MTSTRSAVLRWFGIVVGVIVILGGGAGGYLYASMPKPIGEMPVLQRELFQRPAQALPVDTHLVDRTAVELATMIRERKVTSTEVVQAHINRIKNENYRTNAFVWLFEREALERAHWADEQVARGAPLGRLHGVPVSIKEEFAIEGKPQTLNATMFRGATGAHTAAVVQAWIDEGAIVLGTTNVSNMLFDVQSMGDIYPTANNPYDSTRTPGGSSGGAAASVADALVPLALGGDMGGSIRIPAAFCGLYGLKTTEGSMTGELNPFPGGGGTPRYHRMAVAGPMAKTVDDLSLAWEALMARWPEQRARMLQGPEQLDQYRIAYLDEWSFGNDRLFVGRELKGRLATLVDSLRAHGAQVTRDEPAGFAQLVPMHRLLSVYMAFEHVPWVFRQLMMRDFRSRDSHRFDYSEAYARMTDMDPGAYDGILARRDSLAAGIDAFLTTHDLLILPVAAGPAIAHNPEHEPIALDDQRMAYWDYFMFPLPFNVTGHPALTIPLGRDASGLPLAVQVVGRPFSEPALIAFARLIAPLHEGYTSPAHRARSDDAPVTHR